MKVFKILNPTLALSVMMFFMGCSEIKQVETPEQLINRVNEIYTEVAKAYPNEGELPPVNYLDSLYCSSEWNRMLAIIDSIDSKLDGEIGFFDFDYWIMAQDYGDISADSVVVEKMEADSASVLIQLHNFNHITPVRLEMVKEQGIWMIDNFIDVPNEYNLKLNMKEYIEFNESLIETDSIGLVKEDGKVDVKLSVDYPVKGSQVLLDSLRKFIAHVLGADSTLVDKKEEMLQSAYKHGYDLMMADRSEMMEDDIKIPPYYFGYNIKKTVDLKDFITYMVGYEEYRGGAHGSFISAGTTFTKKDGKEWGWNMLKDTASVQFHQLMKEGVREYFAQYDENKKLNDEQLRDMLIIDGDVNHLPLPVTDPCLLEEGVSFVYQQYEITPYAAGLPSFIIPYAKLMPFFVPEIKEVIPFMDEP